MAERPAGAVRLAGLWSFLAFTALAVVSIWREVPFYYAPADNEQASSKPATLERIAVLPFTEIGAPSPDPLGLYLGQAAKVPEPLRREATEHGPAIVCELGAASNHVGSADGAALARALVRELSATGRYASVRYVTGADELQDETVLISGRVLESQLRILEGGKREYEVGVELSAARWLSVALREEPPFWRGSLRQKAKSGGAGAVYEVSALVRALFADAASRLVDANWNEPAVMP